VDTLDWIACPQFNWCCNCWFNAKIEKKQTRIGIMYLCLNCGIGIHAYEDGTGKGSLGEDLPRHFSDEEWLKWNEEYRKSNR